MLVTEHSPQVQREQNVQLKEVGLQARGTLLARGLLLVLHRLLLFHNSTGTILTDGKWMEPLGVVWCDDSGIVFNEVKGSPLWLHKAESSGLLMSPPCLSCFVPNPSENILSFSFQSQLSLPCLFIPLP